MKEGRNLLHSHADGNQEVSGPQKINSPQRDFPRRSFVSVRRCPRLMLAMNRFSIAYLPIRLASAASVKSADIPHMTPSN